MKDNVFAYIYGDNLYINLTNKCCNDCTFCLRNSGDGVDGNVLWLQREPSAQEAIDAAEKLLTPKVREMVFCGYGEPCYKVAEIVEVARFAHARGLKTRLNTNGLGNLINGRDIVGDLKGAIDVVSVSLNEANAEKYNRVCRSVYGENAYQALKDFTLKCAESGIKTIMTVVDVIDAEDIALCERTAKECKATLRVRRYSKTW